MRCKANTHVEIIKLHYSIVTILSAAISRPRLTSCSTQNTRRDGSCMHVREERIYHKCTELWKNHVFDRDSIHSSVHLLLLLRRQKRKCTYSKHQLMTMEIDGWRHTRETRAFGVCCVLCSLDTYICCTTIKMDKMFVLNVDLNSPI